jgi:hypothetical protein
VHDAAEAAAAVAAGAKIVAVSNRDPVTWELQTPVDFVTRELVRPVNETVGYGKERGRGMVVVGGGGGKCTPCPRTWRPEREEEGGREGEGERGEREIGEERERERRGEGETRSEGGREGRRYFKGREGGKKAKGGREGGRERETGREGERRGEERREERRGEIGWREGTR